MTDGLAVLAALAMGGGSAVLPILNAEAYALVAAGTRPRLALALVLALAVGQTAGKLLLFEAGRRGSARLATRRALRPRRARPASRWGSRAAVALARRRTAIPVMLAAASVGLPPLAIVSVAAGAAGHSRGVFAATCLVGRVARFATIAIPVALAVRH